MHRTKWHPAARWLYPLFHVHKLPEAQPVWPLAVQLCLLDLEHCHLHMTWFQAGKATERGKPPLKGVIKGQRAGQGWALYTHHPLNFLRGSCQLSILQDEHGCTCVHSCLFSSCLALCRGPKFQPKIYEVHDWGQQEQPSHLMNSFHFYYAISTMMR